MLALLAAAVIASVAGQIDDSGRDQWRVKARFLAEAGLRFADDMLTNSPQGADWRPVLPPYLDPRNAAFSIDSHDYTWDSFEVLRNWDPVSINSQTAPADTPVYYVKYRFLMDSQAISQEPADPNVDYVPGNPGREVLNAEATVPHDYFLLRIEYRPNPADPLSKFLKITSIGRPGDQVTAFEEIVAYKALNLQDYALFVHDRNRRADQAFLGYLPIDINGDRATGDSNRAADSWTTSGHNDFVPLLIEGPVRSNVNLNLQAPVRLQPLEPGGGWTDGVAVSGHLSTAMSPGATDGNVQVQIGDPTAGGYVTYANGNSEVDRNEVQAPSGNAWPANLAVGVPAIAAPPLETVQADTGLSRWDRLTRYSGDNTTVNLGGAPTRLNSGELGYGRGIWLDNGGQRDLRDAVVQSWLAPETWGGRRYVPNGAVIELFAHYPNPLDTSQPPALVITRTDGTTWVDPLTGDSTGRRAMVFAWPDKDNTWGPGNPAGLDPTAPNTWPMPDNGVILCDGSVRILGRLPAGDPAAGRDRSLTVVSRGSIYIDGPLLRPSDYTDAVGVDDPANTRIALLARDHVVINPTALAPGQVPGMPIGPFQEPSGAPEDDHWVLSANGTDAIGYPVYVCREPGPDANTPGPLPQVGNMGVSAIEADGNPADDLPANVAVAFHKLFTTIGVQPVIGAAANTSQPELISVYYPSGGSAQPLIPGMAALDLPVWLADWANLARAVYPTGGLPREYSPDNLPVSGGWNNALGSELGVANFVTAQALGAFSRSDVIVKNSKVERLPSATAVLPGQELVVSALMFAEQGTFFIIPGDWYDPRAQDIFSVADFATPGQAGSDVDLASARLARLKRYNYRITINGAISVNNLPSLDEQAAWAEKWVYPDGGAGEAMFNDYDSIVYRYDWGLRAPSTLRPNLPRLPALPAAPGLIYAGEENKT